MNEEMNIGKGLLFSIVVAVILAAVWIAIIALTGFGIGGAVGGAIAGGVGAIISAAYQKGAGRVNILGYVIIVILTIIAVVGALALGVAFHLANEGLVNSFADGLDILFADRTLRFAFIQDALISGAISAGMAIATTIGSGKEKDKQKD